LGRKLSDGIFPQGDSFQFPREVVSPWGDSSPGEIVSYFLREAVFPGQCGCPGEVVPWDGGFLPGGEMLRRRGVVFPEDGTLPGGRRFHCGERFWTRRGVPRGGFWELRRKMEGRAGKKRSWSDGEGRYATGAGSG
jgi:hypothetical protein